MNNETTASQRKSIGDDAQFQRLLRLYVEGTAGQWELVSHIDSKLRAPAAQASATIQAAPEGYAIVPKKPTEEMESAYFSHGNFRTAYTAMLDAATIQEPVMVAEPVKCECKRRPRDGGPWEIISKEQYDEGGFAFEFQMIKTKAAPVGVVPIKPIVKCEECDGKGGTVTAEWVDPISGPECEGDVCGVCGGSGVTDELPLFHAAPMVADPAGVAGLELSDEGIVKVLASFGIDSTESKYDFDALQVATTVPSIRRVVETYLAATVKAVPSEAQSVAGAPILWIDPSPDSLDRSEIEMFEGVKQVAIIGSTHKFGDYTMPLFAAPLAGKKGGGE